MVQMSRAYTPAEAAAVSEIAVKSVHNAIDKRIIARRLSEDEGRALSDDDLLRLKLCMGSARSCRQSAARGSSTRSTRILMPIPYERTII